MGGIIGYDKVCLDVVSASSSLPEMSHASLVNETPGERIYDN